MSAPAAAALEPATCNNNGECGSIMMVRFIDGFRGVRFIKTRFFKKIIHVTHYTQPQQQQQQRE